MPRLFFTPTSCGAASFIAARKAGLIGTKIQAAVVDIGKHVVLTGSEKGQDFYKINPKGNVPCVVLDDGTILNENAATLQWIADQNPAAKLAPANGTSQRYELQGYLSYVSSELHSTVGGLFNPTITPEVKAFILAKYATKLEYVNKMLAGKKFLLGSDFTVADSYLYIVLSWSGFLQIDLSKYENVNKYFEGIKALDFVKEAHAEMATYQ